MGFSLLSRPGGRGWGEGPGVRGRAGWVGWLFLALALLYVLPFWIVTNVPTVDGPCHTYNAWILRQYHNTQEYPLFSRYYDLDLRPHPNWIGHAAMALLMFPFEPRTAERILVSGYVLLFLGAVWYLAGAVEPERRAFAFLGFPFVFNVLFQMGFYNFCFSVGFFLLAVALWWRRRERPGPGFAAALNLVLLLCYFSHIVSLLLALFAIGVLWLTTLRRESWKRHLLHVPILLPQLALPLWFVRAQGAETTPEAESFEVLLGYLRRLDVLVSFSDLQFRLGFALAVLFPLLIAFTLVRESLSWTGRLPGWRFRGEDGFLLLALLIVVLYFAGPAGGAGGTMLKPRLSLYPFLLLIPWFSARMPRPVRTAGVAALAVLALLNLGYVIHWYRVLDGEMKTFLAGLERVRPDSRLLPLLFNRSSAARLGVFGHAADYAALEKGLVDWDNYEADTDLFPVRFKPGLKRPTIYQIEALPGDVEIDAYRGEVDYVYLWKKPPELWIPRLRRYYVGLGGEGPGQLWRRKTPGARRVSGEGEGTKEDLRLGSQP